jgi:uncharacterized protein (TIGR02265 family)
MREEKNGSFGVAVRHRSDPKSDKLPPEEMNVVEFADPPWASPLNAESELSGIPAEAAIAGMFFLGLSEGAKRRAVDLPLPRPRYLPFSFYPVAEFAPLLVQAARLFYPLQSVRQGLRLIGQAGPSVLVASMLGKVTLGSAEGVHAVTNAVASTYSINIRSSHCSVLESTANSMRLSLEGVHYFLDSHHVGVFEGTLRFAGANNGTVKIANRNKSRGSAELLLQW